MENLKCALYCEWLKLVLRADFQVKSFVEQQLESAEIAFEYHMHMQS